MPQHDFDRLMHDHFHDLDGDHAPARLAERIESIPDTEPDSSITPQGWRQRLGRWLGRDDGDMRSADVHGRSRPTKDGRNRLMIIAGATVTAAFALAFGGTYLGVFDDMAPLQPADESPPSAQIPTEPNEFLRAGPVTITSCDTRLVVEGEWYQLDVEDDILPSHRLGLVEASTWESSGSLYGLDDPRLTGSFTRTTNYSSGSSDGLYEVEVSEHALRLESDGGAWAGTTTTFGQHRDLYLSPEMATLHGEGAYDGLTAVLQLPGSVEEPDAPPECFDIHGIVIESGAPPTPDPIDAEVVGLEPVPANATIGTAFQDDAFLPVEETDFVLAPGTWTIEFMNASDQDRGFVIEDPSGRVVAGGVDDLIAPGDMRSYELEITGSGEGYVMYDPTDREGTETAIPADGE